MYNKKNVYTVLISIAISILLIELGLRTIGFNKYQFKGYPPYYLTTVGDYDNFDIKDSIADEYYGFKKTDFIFNDSKPHKVWGNEVGCFDESITNIIGDKYILVAGDSNSWGYVPYNKNWTYLLEKKIRRRHKNYRN